MGTDIHGVFQRKIENGWEDIPSEYNFERHYLLFSWLADVRNGRGFAGIPTYTKIQPLAAPRGLPEDFKVDENDNHPNNRFDILPSSYRAFYNSLLTNSNVAIPDDYLNIWMGYHDFSWLTADEILNGIPSNEEVLILRTGVISLEKYKTWDEHQPKDWVGDIWGTDVVISLPNEITPETTHVRVEWFISLQQELQYFIDEVQRLKDLHGEVRFVFGFDS
jgi:hypothetical protein